MKLIKNGTLVYPGGSRRADLLIDGETIAKIADRIEAPEGCEIIDAEGKLVFPGFIDAHTHFDLHVAGTVTIDDFYSGTKAEVAGGTTTIVDFGTAYPGESLNEGLDNWFKKASAGCSCDYGFHQTITEWNDSISKEVQDMVDRGASTFKIYMTYDTQIDDCTILKVLKRLKECGTTTGCHCENSGLIDALREEYAADPSKLTKVSSHYLTRPAAAEAEAPTEPVIQALDDNMLEPEEAVWLGDEYGWQLHFGSTWANLGTVITPEKIQQLAALYTEVKNREGIIHLEYYESGDEIVRFEQGLTTTQ